MFQSRFVEAYGPGEQVHLSFRVGPLAGRKLVALRWEIAMGYGAPEPCRAPYFIFDKTIDAEMLRSGWESACAEVLKQFVELFPNHRISQDTLLKYKTRQF